MEVLSKRSDNGIASDADIAVVRRLCEEWPRLTRADYDDMLTADCAYINMPWPDKSNIGRDLIYRMLSTMKDRVGIELELLRIAAGDGAIFAERIERFYKPPDTAKSSLYVAGVFEVKDGKISVWRDYFDADQIKVLLGG